MAGKEVKIQDIIDYREAEQIFKQINTRYARGKRNLALFKLCLNTGMRVSEICNLQTRYINFDKLEVTIKNGKGHKDRKVPFPADIIPYIKEWINEKESRGIESKYLFCSYSKGKEGKKLLPRYIQIVLKNYVNRAGIEKDIHPHCLRHTYSTALFQQSKDLEALRRILGHSRIQTTQIYMNHYSATDLQETIKSFRAF